MEDRLNFILQKAGYDLGCRQEDFGKDRREIRIREDIPSGMSTHQWRAKTVDNLSDSGLPNGI